MNYRTIEVQTAHGTAVLWLARPEVRNAFNETVIAELGAALDDIERDPKVRALVLAGRGRAFCAGADLDWMRRIAQASEEENRADALALARLLHRLWTFPKPTLARVHGAAFAGGIGLVAACDIAVAEHGAEFCLSEVKLGLVPATISPYVIAAIGERAARRYMLTAERFTAAEAYRIGLLHEITVPEELDKVANALLGELVQGGPMAQARTKELIRAVVRRPIDDALIADTAARIAAARASPEGQEGLRAFFEKKPPAWVAEFKRSVKAAKRRG